MVPPLQRSLCRRVVEGADDHTMLAQVGFVKTRVLRGDATASEAGVAPVSCGFALKNEEV